MTSLGYEPPPEDDRGPDFARCTFVSGRAQVDVLAPDDATGDRLDAGTALRSIAIPGGRRALATAEPTRIFYADDREDVVIRVPTLTGAIAVKAAAAVDRRTRAHPRHIQDVAFLLTCIEDPAAAAPELSGGDRALLRTVRDRLVDGGDVAWQPLDRRNRQRALAALDLLVGR